jgi:hypothetical protein
MFGFKKSIMYPVVALLDENGRKAGGRVSRYEILPAENEAVSLKSEWSFGISGPGKYYFVVMADMSEDALTRMNLYTKEQAYALGGAMGALTMNYPVYRSAFAKYYFKYYY